MSKQKTAQQLAEEALLFKSKKYYTIEQMADTIEANSNALNKILSLPRLSIPKKIAEELEELTVKTNWECTPYSVVEENGKINTWAYLGYGKCSEQLYKFCRDNTRLMHAYLNPLTRTFVEIEG